MVHRPADIEARARHWIRSAQSLSTVTKQSFLAKNMCFSICSFFYLGFEIGPLENTGSRNWRKWVYWSVLILFRPTSKIEIDLKTPLFPAETFFTVRKRFSGAVYNFWRANSDTNYYYRRYKIPASTRIWLICDDFVDFQIVAVILGWWWTSEIENYSKAGACGKAFELFSCSKQLRNKSFSRRKFVALIVQNWKTRFCISAFENFRSRPGRICLLFGHNLSEMLIFKPRYHKSIFSKFVEILFL